MTDAEIIEELKAENAKLRDQNNRLILINQGYLLGMAVISAIAVVMLLTGVN